MIIAAVVALLLGAIVISVLCVIARHIDRLATATEEQARTDRARYATGQGPRR